MRSQDRRREPTTGGVGPCRADRGRGLPPSCASPTRSWGPETRQLRAKAEARHVWQQDGSRGPARVGGITSHPGEERPTEASETPRPRNATPYLRSHVETSATSTVKTSGTGATLTRAFETRHKAQKQREPLRPAVKPAGAGTGPGARPLVPQVPQGVRGWEESPVAEEVTARVQLAAEIPLPPLPLVLVWGPIQPDGPTGGSWPLRRVGRHGDRRPPSVVADYEFGTRYVAPTL